MKYSRTTYLVILGATALWCAGILLAPVCREAGEEWSGRGELLYSFYHPVCHQNPDRSLSLIGAPLGVCVRCSAIYFAFLIGLLLFPILRDLRNPAVPSRRVLLVAIIPMVVDAVWPGSLFYAVTNASRAVTGALFGLILPFVIIPIALRAIHEMTSIDSPLPLIEKGNTDA